MELKCSVLFRIFVSYCDILGAINRATWIFIPATLQDVRTPAYVSALQFNDTHSLGVFVLDLTHYSYAYFSL